MFDNEHPLQQPNLEKHYPDTMQGQHRGQHQRSSWGWTWGKRRCLSLTGWSGCCSTAGPNPAPHTVKGTLSQSQRPLGTTSSARAGGHDCRPVSLQLSVKWSLVRGTYGSQLHVLGNAVLPGKAEDVWKIEGEVDDAAAGGRQVGLTEEDAH